MIQANAHLPMHDGIAEKPRLDASFFESLAGYMPRILETTRTPGLSITIGQGGRIEWSAGFGVADIARQVPMRPDTVTRAASLSKLYTAVAVMQLVESGIIGLYDAVNQHLPKPGVTNPLGEREVTVYDLLTFRSGLALDTADSDFDSPPPLDDYVWAELRRNVRREYCGRNRYDSRVPRWQAKVGERYQYSNFGIAVLGLVVEAANPEDLSFSDYVQRHVIDALGMTSTTLRLAADPGVAALEHRLSNGYARFGETFVPSPNLQTPIHPAAGVLTTAPDTARLMLAMLGGGQFEDTRILHAQTIDHIITPQVETNEILPGESWWNGLVVEIANVGTDDFHFGELGAYPWGWVSGAQAYPHYDCVIVVVTNKWDMPRYYNPPAETAQGLIADFTTTWLTTRRRLPQGGGTAIGWKRAYVVGLIMGERCWGLLGARGRIGRDDIQAMARGAFGLDGERRSGAEWNPDGFAVGMEDILATEMTPRGIESFLASDRLRISKFDLELISLELSRKGGIPIPMRYYADVGRRGLAH